jgi:tRNA A37 N6-isopentenylltransferase MiaA
MASRRSTLTFGLYAAGVLLFLVGLLYVTVNSSSLPFFIPGHAAMSHVLHVRRGRVALIVGGTLLLIAVTLSLDASKVRRRKRHASRSLSSSSHHHSSHREDHSNRHSDGHSSHRTDRS